MFYNSRFFLPLALFFGFVFGVWYGALAIKVRAYEVPWGRGIPLEGRPAVIAGGVLVVLGLLSLYVLLTMPVFARA